MPLAFPAGASGHKSQLTFVIDYPALTAILAQLVHPCRWTGGPPHVGIAETRHIFLDETGLFCSQRTHFRQPASKGNAP